MPKLCLLNSQRPLQLVRCFGSTGGNKSLNLPENDTIKSLSSRDKQFFSEVEKLRSSLHYDPPVLTKGFYPTAITNKGVFIGSSYFEFPSQPLPQLHASAVLDPKHFCRISAAPNATINGSDAAQRLIRGKRHFLKTIRKETNDEANQDVQKIYLLRDHGVPNQLLQHHLRIADSWLYQQGDVYELSVKNVFDTIHYDSMLIRSGDGSSLVKVWPEEWKDDMELYFTVMNRITTALSSILSENEGLSQLRLKQWNVYARRDMVLPPQLLSEGTEVTPVVEFDHLKGSAGTISIRLQNNLAGDERPISIVFVGTFDTKQEILEKELF
mmetsp:Transcript_8053/g.11688  ORF Transcript_8053/g.11688 Transcript_8053/m.11688 type:complete len:326 (+) Transcript_8053:174-1151(+)|eukprot:CAMPEP_0194213970 /NCGR_PEP_ID=MMETSP0156-20130528/14929_1 /TAXON_ID=33649 /ORGANISM="Thalassionema nitzschioides, Strain L26-B" /LENGTH=325 /DNA_ID=CAMNT_0038942129 /DNA_START=78 /DNA_END=1055 /DNA_ORIENTATION=-